MFDRKWFGRVINIKTADGKRKKYSIDNLSQEKCVLADGTTGQMVSCRSFLNPKVGINLHPDALVKIFMGKDDTHTLDEIAIIDQVAEKVPHVPTPRALKGRGIKPIKETKKERAYEIYNRFVASGGTKSMVIQAFMSQLSMSKAGANTYYHNIVKDII